METDLSRKEPEFNSNHLQLYMNAGVPLSKESIANIREEKSSERRANLVLPKIFPQAFSISHYGSKKFGARASSIERNRGNHHYSVHVSFYLFYSFLMSILNPETGERK